MVHHIGILELWNQTIQKRLQQVTQSELYQDRNNPKTGDHTSEQSRNGKFSPKYNQLKRVRKMKFASIDDKVKKKDFARLSLYQTTDASLNRKNLAILLLPLVTNNGASRSINKPPAKRITIGLKIQLQTCNY